MRREPIQNKYHLDTLLTCILLERCQEMGAFCVRTNEISNGQTLCKHILKSLGKKNLAVKAAPCYDDLSREKFDVDLCKKNGRENPRFLLVTQRT